MPKRDLPYDPAPDREELVRLARDVMRRGGRRRRGEDGGASVPADRGPKPLPLAGGAEAPLD